VWIVTYLSPSFSKNKLLLLLLLLISLYLFSIRIIIVIIIISQIIFILESIKLILHSFCIYGSNIHFCYFIILSKFSFLIGCLYFHWLKKVFSQYKLCLLQFGIFSKINYTYGMEGVRDYMLRSHPWPKPTSPVLICLSQLFKPIFDPFVDSSTIEPQYKGPIPRKDWLICTPTQRWEPSFFRGGNKWSMLIFLLYFFFLF